MPGAEAYLEIANYAGEPQRVRVWLARGATVIVDRAVDLAAGEVARQTVPIGSAGDPRLRARLTAPANALAIDDEAVAWLAASEPLDVIVVSERAGALEQLLTHAQGLRASVVPPAAYRSGSEDVVVLDRWLPAARPGRPALCIAPPPADWLGALGDEERAPRWTVEGPHPILRGVDPLTLDIRRARAYTGPDLVPIARSDRGTPLVAVSDKDDGRLVVLAFGLGDSNLAMAPAFPVLIGNALEWLARPELDAPHRPGRVTVPASTTKVTAPDGAAVRVVRGGDRAWTVLAGPGLYRVEAGGSRSVVAVNVGDREVSNLARTSLAGTASGPAAGDRSGRPWWIYGVTIAFLLMAAEWWTWQRRITV
jgi:hypothetical protein